MIQINDILMGRANYDELPAQLKQNIKRLLDAIHELEKACPIAFKVTSGYRPPAINAAAGGASKSCHMTCEAVDLACDGKLMAWCLQNLEQLQKLGLYLEDPRWTHKAGKGWIHLQTRRPSSGKRIFIPNTSAPTDSTCWDGAYNSKYNS